jgi:hypothetical protein
MAGAVFFTESNQFLLSRLSNEGRSYFPPACRKLSEVRNQIGVGEYFWNR